ncbi:MAG: hypothetical protein V4623_01400 [Pseudomonadota bacterium]
MGLDSSVELNAVSALPVLSAAAALAGAQHYLAQGQGLAAVQMLQTALEHAPNDIELLLGLGVAWRFVGQIESAATAFLRCLSLDAQRADAQVYLGMIRLAQNDQQQGWPLYQARWRAPYWTEKLRYPAPALWKGQVSSGMRLLLWAEQGFGDALQFVRYAPWLLALLRTQGASLSLEVPANLLVLVRTTWPFMDIAATGEIQGRFDAHLPLMDLPHLWGGLGAGHLPYQAMPVPYLSALPDPLPTQRGALAPQWRAVEAKPLHVGRVGIVWQGRFSHPDDYWRSINPRLLDPLFAVPGVRWVSLQKQDALSPLQQAKGAYPDWLPDDLAQCQNFSDSASIVNDLDLVISIDSAMAHLAGALGRPVWLLLPKITDWRWQLSDSVAAQSGNEQAQEITPWYPSMRLFRQIDSDASWSPLIARVAAALTHWCARRAQKIKNGLGDG